MINDWFAGAIAELERDFNTHMTQGTSPPTELLCLMAFFYGRTYEARQLTGPIATPAQPVSQPATLEKLLLPPVRPRRIILP